MDETSPLLVFEAMEEGWWLLVVEMKLLTFGVIEGGSLLVDEMNPLLVFEVMVAAAGPNEPLLTFEAAEGWW